MKSGKPIPRSNSLQRIGSLQTSSLRNSRSSSFLGLQTNSNFQFDSKQAPAAVRSRSLADSAKPKGRKPGLAQKPRTIKKHVPGPYGLITIEVPIEEEEERIRQSHQKRSSFTSSTRRLHLSDNGSLRSASLRSITSNSSIKRTVIVEHLKDVQEDFPLDFDSSNHDSSVKSKTYLVTKEKHHDLTSITEEEIETKPVVKITKLSEDVNSNKKATVPNEKEELSVSEEIKEEPKIEVAKEHEPTPATKEEEVIKETKKFEPIVNDKENIVPKIETEEKPTVIDTEVNASEHDESIEVPSTAKSNESSTNEAESSFTELDSEDLASYAGGGISMAQQLRQRIFLPKESQDEKHIEQEPVINDEFIDAKNSVSGQSSVYSAEPVKSDDEIPARSTKRDPLKSALKNPSMSNLNAKNVENPASAAYLSLTTAENTRLNALSNQAKQNGSSQNGAKKLQNLRQNSSPQKNQRPQSLQITRTPSQIERRPQSQAFPKPPFQAQQPRIARSPSSLAAVNATKKKDEPKPIMVRKSSFEKDRPTESNAAFKRMSLRDPTVNQQYGQMRQAESHLGFYRDQAANPRAFPQHQQSPTQVRTHQPLATHHESSSSINLPSAGAYKSRFSDSDSDIDVSLSHQGFAPPPNNPTLRKPKSQYTLRSTSAASVPSPQKSLPEQRNTRYFSESADHHNLKEKDQKKKKSFGGKLKKLFGRSKE